MKRRIDLTNQRFGRLVVLMFVGKEKWSCHCDCGKIVEVYRGHLRDGHTKSCGCLRKDTIYGIRYKHGEWGTKLYHIWKGIKGRCGNIINKAWKYYGDKGVKVHAAWALEYTTFRDWAYENGYKEGLSIDRINSKGNYEPSNCQWLTRSQHAIKTHKERGHKEANNG